MFKSCKICKMIKPVEQFHPCGKYKDKQYYRGDCIECNNEGRRGQNLEYHKEYKQRPEIKERIKKYKKTEQYLESSRKRENKKYNNDLNFRLKKVVRSRLNSFIRTKNWIKTTKFEQYIGCSLKELKQHLEKQFTVGMTWETYGHGENKWTVDHIIPLSSAKTEEEMYKLCHFSNLQPMWYLDNIKKSNKMEYSK